MYSFKTFDFRCSFISFRDPIEPEVTRTNLCPCAGQLVSRLVYSFVQILHDDVDHHGNQGEPEEHVDGGGDEELGVMGHDVSEPDGREGDEGEIEGVQEGPILEGRVDDDAEEDVETGDEDGDDRRKFELGLVRFDGNGALGEDHAGLLQGDHHPHHAAVARVVEPTDERPEMFEATGEELAELRQDDEAERNADHRVRHRHQLALVRRRDDVAVTCVTHDILNKYGVTR